MPGLGRDHPLKNHCPPNPWALLEAAGGEGMGEGCLQTLCRMLLCGQMDPVTVTKSSGEREMLSSHWK